MEERLKKIKAFAFDVDGVLTDGGILANLDGELFRTFDSKDGFGLRPPCTDTSSPSLPEDALKASECASAHAG